MRLTVLCSLVAVCAGGRDAVAPVADEPISAPPVAPSGVTVNTAPCPLALPLKGEPACRFEPVEASGPALQRASRYSCTLATTPQFVAANRTPALTLTVSITEGSTSFGLRYLRDVSGKVHVVPDTLSEPALLDDALVGLTPLGDEPAFWKGGTCEAVSGGRLLALAPHAGGEVVALQRTVEHDHRVLLRSRDGAWSTLGLLPRGVEPRLRSEAGRVAVLATRAYPAEWEALLPDFGRTLVLRRTETPSFDSPRASVPLAPVPGSRFSSAATLHAGADGEWYVRQPGAPRVLLPIPRTLDACRLPEPSEKPGAAGYLRVHSPALTLGKQVLVAWLEERGRCEYTLVSPPPVRCARGQPCAPPQGPRWTVLAQPVEGEVVVARVGADVDELTRVKLAAPPGRQWVFGTSLAATEQQVFIQAWGHLLELDRRALEAR